MRSNRRRVLRGSLALGAGWLVPLFDEAGSARARPLPARRLAQFVDALPQPARLTGPSLELPAVEFRARLHRDLPATRLWGYGGTYPGPTIVATRGVPLQVRWTNELRSPALLAALPIDETLHWADPLASAGERGQAGVPGHGRDRHGASSRTPAQQRAAYRGPIPLVPHLHGGETEPQSDGHPDAWFTPGFRLRGPGFGKPWADYANAQPAGTLWYHDHALGITRLTVYAGLAGFYLVRDPARERALSLPEGRFEREILLQDRSFDTNGQLLYPRQGLDPARHTHWVPEFFGDTIVVNGKCWPTMAVEPRRYRLRLLNGANARFFRLRLSDRRPFVLIGADGALLPMPQSVESIVLAPGERADVILDLTGASPGSRLRLLNDAPTPFPEGEEPDPRTTGRVLEFRIVPLGAPDRSAVPDRIAPLPDLGAPAHTRRLTLEEEMGPHGPVAVLLDGRRWNEPATERPRLGTTEVWEIFNLTEDAHPIHVHLVHFRLLERQRLRAGVTAAAIRTGREPAELVQGTTLAPDPAERGWKDTVRANPREVTRIAIRFTPMDGGDFPFDPTAAPGYVWHCHVLEHEDNEMMRPLQLLPRGG